MTLLVIGMRNVQSVEKCELLTIIVRIAGVKWRDDEWERKN